MIVRPRLTDYYNIPLLQSEVDFAIPFVDEDIPLYVDPFLLWKSPSQMDNSCHLSMLSSFNNLGRMYIDGDKDKAINNLIYLTECNEVGLGLSKTRKGRPISYATACEILELYKSIPQVNQFGFKHIEQIQLLVNQISKDRISDISCSLLKSFLIDYTIDNCKKYNIPQQTIEVPIFDYKKLKVSNETVPLPINDETKEPILLVPKRWLRFSPWINYDDYFKDYLIQDIENEYNRTNNRIEIFNYNRKHFEAIEKYVSIKESNSGDCNCDPLFPKISIDSANKKVQKIHKLPTGKTNNADKEYEDLMVKVLTSMLYPHLDFVISQSRTDTGTQIRDLIFYNNTSIDFLSQIYKDYDCRQIVVELKNVESIEREHINQLNRYMTEPFGRFGILFTRKKPSKRMIQNTVDLWSGQRRCILILDDSDLELMRSCNSNVQRQPIEVIKKKYIEFTRLCPN